jgi:hypothetical protein
MDGPYRDERGRAIFSLAFVVYGILLLGMTGSAAMMNLMTETWARPELNTLQRIIPLVYLSAVIFFFARARVYIVCLIAAYAYDLWFQFRSGSLTFGMLFADYPVWTALVIFTLVFGFAYRGFRFRWWLARREQHNGFLDS